MATNRFKIRRESSIPSTANLESFELGYVTGSGRLYINANGTMRQVGGTVSQAAVSSSSTHDQIPTALAVYNYGNGAFLKLTGGTISGDISFGTDAIRRASAGNMLFFGNNPGIVDTVENWTTKGFGWAWLTQTGQVTDQPSSYGFLLNIPINTSGTECHQMFMVQSGGAVFHRGGNSSGWATAWKQMWDSTNMPLPLGTSQGGTGRTDGKVAALVTPRQINGVNFDGTGNITITANPNSHNHSTSNITSGTLGTARGGTGQTSLQATRNDMGLGNTTGALPIANGGTGQTTAAAARNTLGLGNTTGALPIANGGTGSNSVANAQAGLGIKRGSLSLDRTASGTSSHAVSFGKTFGSAPAVVISVENDEWTADTTGISHFFGIQNRSTTGFNMYWIKGNTSRRQYTVHWIAIGV